MGKTLCADALKHGQAVGEAGSLTTGGHRMKKPQAFSRCGPPGSKLFGSETAAAAPVQED